MEQVNKERDQKYQNQLKELNAYLAEKEKEEKEKACLKYEGIVKLIKIIFSM